MSEKTLNRLDFSFGKSFPTPAIYAGYLFVAIGLVMVVMTQWFGIVLVLFGVGMAMLRSGVEIDLKEKKWREYVGLLGLKKGVWTSYNEYVDIAILKVKVGFKATSFGMSEMSDAAEYFDVHILNKTHRKKQAVARFKNQQEAISEGRKLAEMIGMTFTSYRPKVSTATRTRR